MSSGPPNRGAGAPSDAEIELDRRAQQLFEAVVDLDTDAREQAIATACVGAPELEARLRRLLALDDAESSLDTRAGGEVGTLIREAMPALDDDPKTIGPYLVLRRLGEGGMGRVYLARRSDSPVAKDVAIKLIRSDRAGHGLLQRFEAERRHLAALDHPGISRFLDAASLPDGRPYVVMEAVEGEPLLDYCARRQLDLRGRLELLRKLVAAVAHAHDRLLVHRDIKPQNVLVTAEGEPKLLDFGIAKSLEADSESHTRTADRFFTPNASAPEQLLGQAVGVGCDVYALGTLAYELLSGRPPFDFAGLRAAEIERLILQVAPPPMSERAPQPLKGELQGDLDAIVATCLRKSPAERYANVGALDADLRRYLEGRPVTARAPTWVYRARLFLKRHRVAAALTGALAAAIIASAGALALQALELREQRNLAVVERDRALKVVEILESAFRNADPARAAGDAVTARQILDAAAPSIDALEKSQPEVFARLATTLARVELDLAQSERAAAWISKGLRAAEASNTSEETISTLLLAGVLSHARAGDRKSAREMLVRLETMGLSDNPGFVLGSARTLYAEAKYAESASGIEKAIARSPDLIADPQDLTSNELRWLYALALSRSGSIQASIEHLVETAKWQDAGLPEGHPWRLRTRMLMLSNQSLIEASEALVEAQKQLISELDSVYGAESTASAVTRQELAKVLGRLGKYSESISIMRVAYRSMVRNRGPNHADSIRAGVEFGAVLLRGAEDSNYREALEVLRQSAHTSRSQFGKDAPITVHAQTLLAKCHIQLGDFNDALVVIAESGNEDLHNARSLDNIRNRAKVVELVLESDLCTKASSKMRHCEIVQVMLEGLQARLKSQK